MHVSRPVGFAPSGIPPADVRAWLDIHGIVDLERRIELYSQVLAVDAAWLERVRAEEPKATEGTKTGRSAARSAER